jgi:nucleotide-binding universal stress UspA family protein
MSLPALPTQPVPPSYKIVVGIDYSEQSVRAMRAALDIALHRESQIYAVAVAEGHGPGRPPQESAEMEHTFQVEAQRTLERWIASQLDELEKTGAKLNRRRVAAVVDFGKPADAILEMAEDVRADLVIVGTHGKTGLKRLMVGSVALEAVRRAHCPVLVTR